MADTTSITVTWIHPGELGYKPAETTEDLTAYRATAPDGRRYIVVADGPRDAAETCAGAPLPGPAGFDAVTHVWTFRSA